MIGSEENELEAGEKIGIKDIVYESRFFIVNLLGIIGFVWIGYELLAGLDDRHRLFCGVAITIITSRPCCQRPRGVERWDANDLVKGFLGPD